MTAKYGKDEPFVDPVVICDSCQALLLVVELNELGICEKCGNTRVRNLRIVTEENLKTLEAWRDEGKIDQEFLDIFAPVEKQ